MIKKDAMDVAKEALTVCKDWEDVKKCFLELKEQTQVAFDVETSGLNPFFKDQFLYSIAFSFGNGNTYAIPLYKYFPEPQVKLLKRALIKWLCTFPLQQKIAHNIKFDLLWLCWYLKISPAHLQGSFQDSSILSWMYNERPGMHALKKVCGHYFKFADWGKGVNLKRIATSNLDNILGYNGLDAYACLYLFQFLAKKILRATTANNLYNNLLLPAMLSFLQIEFDGAFVNSDFKGAYRQKIVNQLIFLSEKIKGATKNSTINVNSAKQLYSHFVNIKKYDLTSVIETKTGISLDNKVLDYITEVYNDPLAKIIIRYRKLYKLLSTYVDGLSKQITLDNKFHSSFNLIGTVTGRTSCSNPNLQNFPKRQFKEIRNILVAPEGFKLVSFDYGQIEARLFGILTGDEKFCDLLKQGFDIHLDNSKILFGEDKAKEKRNIVKNSTFALLYGAGIPKVSQMLSCPETDIKKIKSLIFDRFPQFKIWQRKTIDTLEKKGYLVSLFGRVRRAPLSYTETLNYITQSSASDMTLASMIVLYKSFQVMAMIHDDLTFYLKDDSKLESNIDQIISVMLNVPYLTMAHSPLFKEWVQLEVECAIGLRWGNMKVYKKVSHPKNYNLTKSLEKARFMKDIFRISQQR